MACMYSRARSLKQPSGLSQPEKFPGVSAGGGPLDAEPWLTAWLVLGPVAVVYIYDIMGGGGGISYGTGLLVSCAGGHHVLDVRWRFLVFFS
jgi:hypothetical protein